MSLKSDFEKIVSSEFVKDDAETLIAYSHDQSFVSPSKPDFVVFPQKVEQVQKLVKLANQIDTPIVPYSSGLNLHGATIPQRGGIILNLSRMNKILEISENDWFVIIEPGVTYEQLQDALQPKDLRLMVPLGVPAKRSVLSSYLERDPLMAAASFEYGNHLLMDMEIVLPDGEVFRTGCWNLGGRPGGYYGPGVNMPFRLWTGAQGTLGIITKLIINVQHLSPVRKFYLLYFNNLEEIIEPVRKIQMREIGWECFGLNQFNLASLFTNDWKVPQSFPTSKISSSTFDQLRKALPVWTVFIGLTGSPHFPEDKISYEEEALQEVCREMGIELLESVPGNSKSNQIFLEESLRSWGILKKFCYKGSVHDLSFKVPLDKMVSMERLMIKLAREKSYSDGDIGGYFLILERGRGVHVEFDLHCDLEDSKESKRVKELWYKSSQDLLDQGALYDRPYGIWSEMSYKKSINYYNKLKQLKAEFDPQGIMNPGKLNL